MPGLLRTAIPDFERYEGKVRDTYRLTDGKRLVVATDRISTFDAVHPTPIPDKGKILTAMSLFWFRKLRELVPDVENHVLETNVSRYGHGLERYRDQLEGRSMIVKDAEVVPLECIARGYIAGSAWKEYKDHGTVGFQPVPPHLKLAEKLPNAVFTPSTKEKSGHDVNISFEKAIELVGLQTAERVRNMTLEVYGEASAFAQRCGIILADTKLEWGRLPDGELILIDEVLTPDSSRFWPADSYVSGTNPPSFDKQYVRDWAEGSGWDKQPPAPALPDEVVSRTHAKYVEALERLTGEAWRG